MSRKTPADEPRSWPFEEARKVLKRTGGAVPETGHVLFATGYGPSGLPHIGTFGEVVRTQMVRRALAELSDLPSRLFAFSDDMDGLRKVPDNIPNADMVARHLGKPLTAIPDPFGTHESFGSSQQRPAAQLPRPFRLRLCVQERDRMLQVGRLRLRRCSPSLPITSASPA